MASMSALPKRLASPFSWPWVTTETTDMPMGSIMMAVAVLLTHMLMKPVAIMNPAICLLGSEPTFARMFRAMRLWRLHFSMARPSRKPPKKR